jgi:GT2 family glycosyltransferase
MSETIDATLIVVNYNKMWYTRACLESVIAADPVPAQIVAIDNGSTDGTGEYLRERFCEMAARSGVSFSLISNDHNVGACTARNQGLEIAEGRYISFMDNDVVVRSRRWLGILAESLEAEERIGIVGPKLVYPFEPYNIQEAGVGISRTGRVKYLGRGEPRDTPEHNMRREVQCLISACWLMKREVPQEIGGLDEIFNPAQFEDFDYCYRARMRGWRVVYEPKAEMYHFESVTTDGSVDVNYRYITIKNGMEFKRRWQSVFSQENGPPDEECRWADLETRPLEETGVPPMIE